MSKPENNKRTAETNTFMDQVSQPHRRINPCFMTGKGCVYTEHIDREIEKRYKLKEAWKKDESPDGSEQKDSSQQQDQRPVCGFTIIPFKPNFLTFYSLCLSRYITGDYSQTVALNRSDSVRKTGYVICEKICKKIQESDFIISDISVPNPNVFYELGLAYGSEQKIILIANQDSVFGVSVKDYFKTAPLYIYKHLDPLTQSKFPLSSNIWKPEKRKPPLDCKTLLLIDESSIPDNLVAFRPEPEQEELKEGEGEEDKDKSKKNKPVIPFNNAYRNDINIDFTTHVKAALGVAIDNIVNLVKLNSEVGPVIPKIYHDWIGRLKGGEKERDDEGIKQATSSNRFQDILERVNQAFCVIIKTGKGCHPIMYFWLGYCHARGKNVIPITAISSKPASGDNEGDSVSDLAFDIRALWHIIFDEDNPGQLENALEETLYQMILNDYSEWSRKRFWDEILDKRGKVSIFTGALQNEPVRREMIGDWDLRAVSELTSYFASHQYRATIESPVYHLEGVKMSQEEYIDSLKNMLKGKNCVIIASPDVNPLTEIVLGQVYGIKKSDWFNGDVHAEDQKNDTVVAFKEVKQKKSNLVFYREEEISDAAKDYKWKRGFITRFLEGLPDQRLQGEFISQEKQDGEIFHVHAHLAVVPNPFSPDERKFIVLLNGVSGPATFALTHVLTGGVSSEFVSYHASDGTAAGSGLPNEEVFDPHSESEIILQNLLTMFIEKDISGENEERRGKGIQGIQCIVDVTVGPAREAYTTPFDWRHILKWELYNKTIKTFDVTYDV